MSANGATARVPGHTLRLEGQPFNGNGLLAWGTGGRHGKCSCGALSPPLPSNNARKRWHREHKADVVAAQRAEIGR